jgi:hypothetical protein
MNDQKISQVIRDYDAAHPYWKQEKRECEIKEAQEAEERARRAREARRQAEQQTTDAAAWWQQHDQRVYQCIKLWVEQWYPPERRALTEAVGEVFAEHRASVREAITNLKERIIRLETASNFEERFTKLTHQVKRGSEIPQGELLAKIEGLQRQVDDWRVLLSLSKWGRQARLHGPDQGASRREDSRMKSNMR